MPTDGKATALVLAGKRDGATDPLAQAAGVTHKCLVPVAGQPMLVHVIDALAASERIGQIRVAIGIDRFGAGREHEHGSEGERDAHHQSASAPAMISISSVVIAAWRLRLYSMLRFLIRSPALRVALSIAVIEAPCSDASRSSKAPNSCVRT